jgi:hypothetical protein
MDFDGGNQQVRIVGPLIKHFVVGHNLVFGLLQFHHLAELIGLAGLALANNFSRRLGQAENLASSARGGSIAAYRFRIWHAKCRSLLRK